MPDTIRDGKGRGYVAGVNDDNELLTSAKTKNVLAVVSARTGKAFTVYGKRNFLAADTNENIFYMKYTGTGQLHIQSITFSSNSSSAKIEVYVDPTSVSGGASITPLTMNRGSGETSETTCLTGGSDLTMTTTAANEIFDVRLNKYTYSEDFDGALILSNGDELGILGEVATIGDKIRVMVQYYEDGGLEE